MNTNEFIGAVITALSTIVGLFLLIGKPINSLTSAITELQVTLKNTNKEVRELEKDLIEMERSNKESHKRLWDKNEEQEKRLSEHENRISKLEK